MDSEGLVILTNDGKLAFRLAHPRYGVERVYEVKIKGQIGRDLIEGLTKGVLLEEGVARAKRVELVKQGQTRGALMVTLTEGRKREVRRMVAGCGYEVLRLKRVRFGNIALGRLPSGSWRNLVRDEVRVLRRLVQEAYERSRSNH
jgi:pseudouridine synthase